MMPELVKDTDTGARQGERRPKMLIAIEHLHAAETHMNSCMTVLSSMIMDLQKGADFIGRYRDSLVRTMEETGGDVGEAIEHQIRDFIPKHLTRGNGDDAQPRES